MHPSQNSSNQPQPFYNPSGALIPLPNIDLLRPLRTPNPHLLPLPRDQNPPPLRRFWNSYYGVEVVLPENLEPQQFPNLGTPIYNETYGPQVFVQPNPPFHPGFPQAASNPHGNDRSGQSEPPIGPQIPIPTSQPIQNGGLETMPPIGPQIPIPTSQPIQNGGLETMPPHRSSQSRYFLRPRNALPETGSGNIPGNCGRDTRPPRGGKKRIKLVVDNQDRRRRHNCEDCVKSFSTRFQLKEHIRVHTGEKPHVCADCGKGFAYTSSLKKHIKSVHLDERAYECVFCHYAFNERQHLQVHLRIHTGEKPVRCEHCGKRFYQESQLRTHACQRIAEM